MSDGIAILVRLRSIVASTAAGLFSRYPDTTFSLMVGTCAVWIKEVSTIDFLHRRQCYGLPVRPALRRAHLRHYPCLGFGSLELTAGIEPATYRLQGGCSAY